MRAIFALIAICLIMLPCAFIVSKIKKLNPSRLCSATVKLCAHDNVESTMKVLRNYIDRNLDVKTREFLLFVELQLLKENRNKIP